MVTQRTIPCYHYHGKVDTQLKGDPIDCSDVNIFEYLSKPNKQIQKQKTYVIGETGAIS